MDMHNRVALVTGAQQGIGAATAVALGQRGARVIVNYLDDESAAAAVGEAVEAAGGRAALVAGDVSSTADVEAMVAAGEAHGGIDLLVNNAGIFPRVDFLQMTEEDWDTVFAVNLRGMFLCTQAVARAMVKGKRPGAVVNLSSAAAHSAPALGVHYASTKAGIIGFTRSASVALAPHDIRVNAIAPGLTDTAQPRYGMTEDEIAQSAQRLPLQRIATPEDIASTIVFLASEAARHVTGQVLHVNGGQLFV